jgi:hypothetical protein
MSSENVVLFIKRNLVIISAVLVVLLFVCVLVLFSFVKKTSSPATSPPSSSNTVLPTGSTVSGESQIPIEKPSDHECFSPLEWSLFRDKLNANTPKSDAKTVAIPGIQLTTSQVKLGKGRLGRFFLNPNWSKGTSDK